MKKLVFQCQGLALHGRRVADTELRTGNCAGWKIMETRFSWALLDQITGLAGPESGSVSWFGCEMNRLSETACLAVLRRTLTLTPDGGMIANISVRENILLPAIHRGKGSDHALSSALAGMIAKRETPCAVAEDFPHRLPHELDPPERRLAAVLRAAFAEPEGILCWHFTDDSLDQEVAWLQWLRRRNPRCAWLFITRQSRLPDGFEGPILPRRS